MGSCVAMYTQLKFRPAEEGVAGEEGVDLNEIMLFPLNNKEGVDKRGRRMEGTGRTMWLLSFLNRCHATPKGRIGGLVDRAAFRGLLGRLRILGMIHLNFQPPPSLPNPMSRGLRKRGIRGGLEGRLKASGNIREKPL